MIGIPRQLGFEISDGLARLTQSQTHYAEFKRQSRQRPHRIEQSDQQGQSLVRAPLVQSDSRQQADGPGIVGCGRQRPGGIVDMPGGQQCLGGGKVQAWGSFRPT